MYVGLKQPRGDGKRYVTPARAAAKETSSSPALTTKLELFLDRPLRNCLVILKNSQLLYPPLQWDF